jgi:flagellar hook assembly protein FlgD
VIACDAGGQILTSIKEDQTEIPDNFVLYQNYPNPFNPVTTIKYGMPEKADVEIVIFNILGQRIRTFSYENQKAGYHHVKWDGKNELHQQVATGLYIYQMRAGKYIKNKKMVLLR